MEKTIILSWYSIRAQIASSLLQESVYVHSSLRELHEHVDPEILPEEFGGSAGPFNNAPIKEERNSFRWIEQFQIQHNLNFTI